MSVGRDTAGACRAGDEARFAVIYDRCYDAIWDYCSRRVAADSVDDAVADTFLTVWRRLDEAPGGEEALLWTFGIAYRMVVYQWRSTARRHRLEERLRTVGVAPVAAVDEEVSVDGDRHRLVLVALAGLGDTDAEILRLVAWERLAVVDVAAVVGIKPEAARQRLRRARRHLAREYDRVQSRSTSTRAVPRGGVR